MRRKLTLTLLMSVLGVLSLGVLLVAHGHVVAQPSGAFSTGRLLGMQLSFQTTPTAELTAIDPATGAQTVLGGNLETALPGLGFQSGVAALDSAGHRYFVVALDQNDDSLLLTLDTQTGALLAQQTLLTVGSSYNSLQFEGASPTPQQQLQALSSQVQALAAAGTLTSGEANELQASLDAASAKLSNTTNTEASSTSSNTATTASRAACNDLGAYINKVDALVRSDRLTAQQGGALIGPAKSVMGQVCG